MCILEHSELVQEIRATAENAMQLKLRSGITDWSSVKDMSALLALAPDAFGAWKLLDIPREGGAYC